MPGKKQGLYMMILMNYIITMITVINVKYVKNLLKIRLIGV